MSYGNLQISLHLQAGPAGEGVHQGRQRGHGHATIAVMEASFINDKSDGNGYCSFQVLGGRNEKYYEREKGFKSLFQ